MEFCVSLAGAVMGDVPNEDEYDVIGLGSIVGEPKEGVGSIMNVPMEKVELKEGVSKPGGGLELEGGVSKPGGGPK